MKKTLFCAALASAALISVPALANDNQLWTSVAVNGPISDNSKFLLWFDGHARYADDASELGVTIVRPGIGYKVSDKLSFWTGYANVISRADGRADITEERIWQQATYTIGSLGVGKVKGRTRLEQRFRNAGNDTGWRIRQTFSYSQQITNNPKLSLVLSNETFYDLTSSDWGQIDGYNQNRAFLGLSYRINDNLSTNFGYLNNHLDNPIGDDRVNHNIAISLSGKL